MQHCISDIICFHSYRLDGTLHCSVLLVLPLLAAGRSGCSHRERKKRVKYMNGSGPGDV